MRSGAPTRCGRVTAQPALGRPSRSTSSGRSDGPPDLPRADQRRGQLSSPSPNWTNGSIAATKALLDAGVTASSPVVIVAGNDVDSVTAVHAAIRVDAAAFWCRAARVPCRSATSSPAPGDDFGVAPNWPADADTLTDQLHMDRCDSRCRRDGSASTSDVPQTSPRWFSSRRARPLSRRASSTR